MKRFVMRLCLLLMLFTLVNPFSSVAWAATASVSVSTSKPVIGKTFSVKVTFRGTNIFAVQASFTYNPSVLQFVSGNGASGGSGNGRIVLVAPSENESSLSTTLKFKAKSIGSSNISVSASSILASDESSLGTASASKTVTVTEKPVSTPGATKQPTATPEPTPSPTPRPIDLAIPVAMGSGTLYLWRDLSTVPLPAGFTAGAAAYEGKEIQIAQNAQTKLLLAYLTDEKGENGAFYAYDGNIGKAFKYQTVAVQSTYTVLELDESAEIPQGYRETRLVLGRTMTRAWILESGEDRGRYLVYAINDRGAAGFYLYDFLDKTFQKYVEIKAAPPVDVQPTAQPAKVERMEPIPAVLPEKETEPAAEPTALTAAGLLQKITGDTALAAVVIGLVSVIVLLGSLLLIAGYRNRKRGKPE